MTEPYYQDDLVTLYHGDCREITEWLAADVLVTDPPYGRDWKQGGLSGARRPGGNPQRKSDQRTGIRGDKDTMVRDAALEAWGAGRPVAAFGDLMLPPPIGTKHVLIYAKPADAGARGAVGGFRRDVEAIYLMGHWEGPPIGGRSAVMRTGAPLVGSPVGISSRSGGHPHAKPIDVLSELILRTEGTIADPFAGSGSTLVAAKMLGRKAIGVEIEERYCEIAAQRLLQDSLPFEVTA